MRASILQRASGMSSLTLALVLALSQTATSGSAAQSAAPETTSAPPAATAPAHDPPPASRSTAVKTKVRSVEPTEASGPISIAVSTQKKILVVRVGGVDVKQYSVAVGTNKKPTPMGQFTIRHIVWNPAWHPPAEKWAKGKKPAAPGDPKNPMKVVKVFFQEPDYYIHGTADEGSLGSAASHGCIRMAQDDVYALARYLQDHAGASKPDSWYVSAINGSAPQNVQLPKGIPIVIGP